MVKEIVIAADAATVKTQGKDIVVKPKRLVMFLTAIIVGFAGISLLALGVGVLLIDLAAGDLEQIGSNLPGIALGTGFIGVAFFAFSKGRSQRAIHFDATNHQVVIGNESIPFDRIIGVYLQRTGRATIDTKSSIIIQTGIIVDNLAIPIVSVSKTNRVQNMSDAVTLVRLYAHRLGHDPSVVGRYDDLININLQANSPVILPFTSNI